MTPGEVIFGGISWTDCPGGIAVDEHEPHDAEPAHGVDWSAITRAVSAGCVAAMMVIGAAVARPPPGADPSLAPWFRSLKQPANGFGCCSDADCRTVDYRINGDHYEVFIKRGDDAESFPAGTDKWVTVPPDTILRHISNPTGRAVACWIPPVGVLCFVESSGT